MRAFAGNDVVDLGDPLRREHFFEGEDGFAERHLSPGEREAYVRTRREERFEWFWTRFAAKEAAFKAFDQAGIATQRGGTGYALLEVNAEESRVVHLATGARGSLTLEQTPQHIHAVVFLEGEEGQEAGGSRTAREPAGRRSATLNPFKEVFRDAPQARLFHSTEIVPSDSTAGDFARDLLVSLAARAFEAPKSRLFVTSLDGRPRLLDRGALLPCSVSLSHSGRFAAASLLVA